MSTRKQPIKSMHIFRLKKESDNRHMYAFCTNLQMVLLVEPFALSYVNENMWIREFNTDPKAKQLRGCETMT